MKLWMKILLGVALALIVALVFAGNYFYNYAVVPSEKDFLDEDTPGTTQTSKETDAHKWFSSKEKPKRLDHHFKRRSEIISDLSSC